VTEGDKIPRCPECGGEVFDTRHHEPGSKSA
jgi:hypothetical protein